MMEIQELNDNDNKLLGFCLNERKTMSEVARFLKIAPKNVFVRLPKLKKANLIKVEKGIGRKVYIRTIEGDKTKQYFLEILKQLKNKSLTEDEYLSLNDLDNRDKFSAPLKMMYTQPKLVERYVKITPAGLKFLKENTKQRNFLKKVL